MHLACEMAIVESGINVPIKKLVKYAWKTEIEYRGGELNLSALMCSYIHL